MEGIKETREALEGSFKLLEIIIKELADGIQLTDAVAIFSKLQSNPQLRKSLEVAAKDIGKVPKEMADLDMQETIALTMIVLTHVPKLLAAFADAKKS